MCFFFVSICFFLKCRAVAAAIFGEDGHVDFFTVSAYDRFFNLLNDEYDMLARATTHTMQRQVFEARTEVGFSFSIQYLYNGLQFAGRMPYVECADNLTVAEELLDGEQASICEDTRICALDGTTHVDIITQLLPNAQLVSTVEPSHLQSNFVEGLCNVIAGGQFDLSEVLVRDLGYDEDYEFGVNIQSKEPLALVTRNDDPEWSDFVNWVLQALLAAEDEGISSRTSNIIPLTDVFGEAFQEAFRRSVRLVGNYGEIYRRHLEDLLPRPVPDRINSGDSGLIYSFPFGGLSALGPNPNPGGTLQAIIDRGHLRCGISRRVIFAQFDPSTQSWAGE
jgi:general L-amino acid transport system substrate-binding protein